MSEKIKCPERDSNPRHPDLMEGALTTELPRQPQWSGYYYYYYYYYYCYYYYYYYYN